MAAARGRGPALAMQPGADEGAVGARLLFTRQETAEVLGMSLSHFQRHVQSSLPCVYSGQLRLYRREDLVRWIEQEVCLTATRR